MAKIRKVDPARLDEKGATSKKRDASDGGKSPRDDSRDPPTDEKAR